MALDVSKYIFIDNHAHPVLKDHLNLDVFGFRQCFTESRSLGIIAEHVQHSLHYMDMISKLAMLLGATSEHDVIMKRLTKPPATYSRLLFDSVSIGALIIDDGFVPDVMMSPNELLELCQRPVFRCRRIETVIERCMASSNSFDELHSTFNNELFDTSSGAVVALKSIMAYRGGLTLHAATIKEASDYFPQLKEQFNQGKTRIESNPLYHNLLLNAFKLAGKQGIPVQLHIGIGDDDALITESNPALLQPWFKLTEMQNTNFVLLHCFPYIRESAMLASLYPNVYVDLSLSISLVSPIANAMVLEALSAMPTTKLLAGTDGHSIPETHWYAALRWKMALQSALNQMIMDGFINPAQAAEIAGRVLHENAKSLYKLEGLV